MEATTRNTKATNFNFEVGKVYMVGGIFYMFKKSSNNIYKFWMKNEQDEPWTDMWLDSKMPNQVSIMKRMI